MSIKWTDDQPPYLRIRNIGSWVLTRRGSAAFEIGAWLAAVIVMLIIVSV